MTQRSRSTTAPTTPTSPVGRARLGRRHPRHPPLDGARHRQARAGPHCEAADGDQPEGRLRLHELRLARPGQAQGLEFCENGAKAVTWEATPVTVPTSFWAENSVTDLLDKSEYWLGMQGRLVEPVYKPAGEDHYTR